MGSNIDWQERERNFKYCTGTLTDPIVSVRPIVYLHPLNSISTGTSKDVDLPAEDRKKRLVKRTS